MYVNSKYVHIIQIHKLKCKENINIIKYICTLNSAPNFKAIKRLRKYVFIALLSNHCLLSSDVSCYMSLRPRNVPAVPNSAATISAVFTADELSRHRDHLKLSYR